MSRRKVTPPVGAKAGGARAGKAKSTKLKAAEGKAQAALDELHETEIFAYNDSKSGTPPPFEETLARAEAGGSKFMFTYAYPKKHTEFAAWCNNEANLLLFATEACIGNEEGISAFVNMCVRKTIPKQYLWVAHVNTGNGELFAFVQVCIFLPLLDCTQYRWAEYNQQLTVNGINVFQINYNCEYITEYSLLHKASFDDQIKSIRTTKETCRITPDMTVLQQYVICNSPYICGKVPVLWNQCATYDGDVCPVTKIEAVFDDDEDDEIIQCTIKNMAKQDVVADLSKLTACTTATQSFCVQLNDYRTGSAGSAKRKERENNTTRVPTQEALNTEHTISAPRKPAKKTKKAEANIESVNNARVADLFASNGWVDRIEHKPQDKLTASVKMQNVPQAISRRKPQPETLLLQYGNDTLFAKVKPLNSKHKAQFYLQKDAHNRHAKLLNVLRTHTTPDKKYVESVQHALDAVYTRGQLKFEGSRWKDTARQKIIDHLSLSSTDNTFIYNFPYLATQLTYNYARTYIAEGDFTIYVGAPKFNSEHYIYKTSDGKIELHYDASQHEFTMYACEHSIYKAPWSKRKHDLGFITSKKLIEVAISTKGYIIEFDQTDRFPTLFPRDVVNAGCTKLNTVATVATVATNFADLVAGEHNNVIVHRSYTSTLHKGDIICYIKDKAGKLLWCIYKRDHLDAAINASQCQQHLNTSLRNPDHEVYIRRTHRKTFIVAAHRQEYMSEMVLQDPGTCEFTDRLKGCVNADDLNASITWTNASETHTNSTISSGVCPSQDIPDRTEIEDSEKYEEYKTKFTQSVLPYPNEYFRAFGTLNMLPSQLIGKFLNGTEAYRQTTEPTALQTIYRTNVGTIDWLRTFLATLNDNREENKAIPKIWRTRILARLNNIPATAKQMLANFQYIQIHMQTGEKEPDPIPAFQLYGDKEMPIYGTYCVTQRSQNNDVVYHNAQKGYYCVCKPEGSDKVWVIVQHLQDTEKDYLAKSNYTNKLIPSSFPDIQVVDLTQNTRCTFHSVLHQEPAQTLIQCLKGQTTWPNYALENAWMQLGKAIDADIVQSNDYIQLKKVDKHYALLREPTPDLNAVLGEYSYSTAKEIMAPCNDHEYYKQFDFLCSIPVYTKLVSRMLHYVKFVDTQINIGSWQVLYAAKYQKKPLQYAGLRNHFVPANAESLTINLRVDSNNVASESKPFYIGNIAFRSMQTLDQVNSCGAYNAKLQLKPADDTEGDLCYGQIRLESKSPDWPGMQTTTFANALQRVFHNTKQAWTSALQIQGTHAAATCNEAPETNPTTNYQYYNCTVYSDNIENIHKLSSKQLTLLTNVDSTEASDAIMHTLYNMKQKWKFILQQIHTPRGTPGIVPERTTLDTFKVVCNGTLTVLTIDNTKIGREVRIGTEKFLILNLRCDYDDDQTLMLEADQHTFRITSQYTFEDFAIPASILECVLKHDYSDDSYDPVLDVAQRINTPYNMAKCTDNHKLFLSLEIVLKSIRKVYRFACYLQKKTVDMEALKADIQGMYTALNPSNLNEIITCIASDDYEGLCTNIVLCIDSITAQAAQDELRGVLSTLTRHKNEATAYKHTVALRVKMEDFVKSTVQTVDLNGGDVPVNTDFKMPIRFRAESAIISPKKDNILDQFGKPFKTTAATYTAYIWPDSKTLISTDNANVVFTRAVTANTKEIQRELDEIITLSGKTLCQHTFKVRMKTAGNAAKVRKQLSAWIGVDILQCTAKPIFLQRDEKHEDTTVTARFKKQMTNKCNVATKPDKGEVDVICAKNCNVAAGSDIIPCMICERRFHLNCVVDKGHLGKFVCCLCQHQKPDTIRHQIETLHKAMYELLYVILNAPINKTNNATIRRYCDYLTELNTAWRKDFDQYTTHHKLQTFGDYAMYQIITFAITAREECYKTQVVGTTPLEFTSTTQWTMFIGRTNVRFTRPTPFNCDQPLTQKPKNPKPEQKDNSVDSKNPTKWFYEPNPTLIHITTYFSVLSINELFNGDQKKVYKDFNKLQRRLNAKRDGFVVLHAKRTVAARDWRAATNAYKDIDDTMPGILEQFQRITCQEKCIIAMKEFSGTAVYRQIFGTDETGALDSTICTTKDQLAYYPGTDREVCDMLCTMFKRLEWANKISKAIQKAKLVHRGKTEQVDGDNISLFAYKPLYVAGIKIFKTEKQMQALLDTKKFTGTIADVCTKYDEAANAIDKKVHGLHAPTLKTTATNCAVECLYKIVMHNSPNTTEAIAFELEWLTLQQSSLARDMSVSQVQVCMELYWWDKQSRSLMTKNVLNDLMFFSNTQPDQQGVTQPEWNIAGQPKLRPLNVCSFAEGFACVDVSTKQTVSFNTPKLCEALQLPGRNTTNCATNWYSLWQQKETYTLYVKFKGPTKVIEYKLGEDVTLDEVSRKSVVGAWYGSNGYGKQPGEDVSKTYLKHTEGRGESFEVSDGLLRKRPVKQHVQWLTNDMFYRELNDYLKAQTNLQNLWQFEKLLTVMPETRDADVTEKMISKDEFGTIRLIDNKYVTTEEDVVVAWHLPTMPKVSLALPHGKTLPGLFGDRITFESCGITTVKQYISPTHLTELQIAEVQRTLKDLIETLNESKIKKTARKVVQHLHDTHPDEEIVQSMYFFKDELALLPAYTTFRHCMDNLIQYGIFADMDKIKCYTQTMFVSNNATTCNPWEKFELDRELKNLYEQLELIVLFYDKHDNADANLLRGAFTAQLTYCKTKWDKSKSTLGDTDKILFGTLAAQVDAWGTDELVKPIGVAFNPYKLNADAKYAAVRDHDTAAGWATFYNTHAAIVAACALYYKNAVPTCVALNKIGVSRFYGSLMATELCNNDALAKTIMTSSWKEGYAPLVYNAIEDVNDDTLKQLAHGIFEAYEANKKKAQKPKPKTKRLVLTSRNTVRKKGPGNLNFKPVAQGETSVETETLSEEERAVAIEGCLDDIRQLNRQLRTLSADSDEYNHHIEAIAESKNQLADLGYEHDEDEDENLSNVDDEDEDEDEDDDDEDDDDGGSENLSDFDDGDSVDPAKAREFVEGIGSDGDDESMSEINSDDEAKAREFVEGEADAEDEDENLSNVDDEDEDEDEDDDDEDDDDGGSENLSDFDDGDSVDPAKAREFVEGIGSDGDDESVSETNSDDEDEDSVDPDQARLKADAEAAKVEAEAKQAQDIDRIKTIAQTISKTSSKAQGNLSRLDPLIAKMETTDDRDALGPIFEKIDALLADVGADLDNAKEKIIEVGVKLQTAEDDTVEHMKAYPSSDAETRLGQAKTAVAAAQQNQKNALAKYEAKQETGHTAMIAHIGTLVDGLMAQTAPQSSISSVHSAITKVLTSADAEDVNTAAVNLAKDSLTELRNFVGNMGGVLVTSTDLLTLLDTIQSPEVEAIYAKVKAFKTRVDKADALLEDVSDKIKKAKQAAIKAADDAKAEAKAKEVAAKVEEVRLQVEAAAAKAEAKAKEEAAKGGEAKAEAAPNVVQAMEDSAVAPPSGFTRNMDIDEKDGDASEATHPADIDKKTAPADKGGAEAPADKGGAKTHGVEETDMETGNDPTAAVSLSLLELVQQFYSGDYIQLSSHIFRQGDKVYKCKRMTPAQHVDANYMLNQPKCLDEIKQHINIPLLQGEIWNRLPYDEEDTEYCVLKMDYSEKQRDITDDNTDIIAAQINQLRNNDYYYTNFHMGHVHWDTDGKLVYFSAETMQQKQYSKRQTLVHTHAKFNLFPPTGNSPMYSDQANENLTTIVECISLLFLNELYALEPNAKEQALVDHINQIRMVDLTYEECCSAFTEATDNKEVWVKLVSVPQATLLEINKCFEPITKVTATWSHVDVPFHTNKLVCDALQPDPLTERETKRADFITLRIEAIKTLFNDYNCFYTGNYGARNERLDQHHMVFFDNPEFNTYSTTQQLWQRVPKDKDIPLPLERGDKMNVLQFVCYFQAFLDKYPFEDPIEKGKASQFLNWSSSVSISDVEQPAFDALHMLYYNIQQVQIYLSN